MNSQDYRNLQEAYLNVYQEIDEAVYGGTPKKPEAPKDDRMVVTNADKKGNTPAYQNLMKGNKGYKKADHMGEATNELDEKVMGVDPEKRAALAAERKSGNKRLPPSSGKEYATNQKKSISYMDKLTKNNKIIPGMTHEEVEEFDEATAMAKRGLDEPAIRNKIAAKTSASGAGKFADKATKLADRETYGNKEMKAGREKLARTQRGDFRNTTSSSPGLRGYGYKSNDSAVKAKQDARGNQRAHAALTPNERKQNNMESYDLFDYMMEYLLAEGYADTNENALVIMANMSEEWRENILTEVSQDEFRAGMMKAAKGMPSDVRTPSRDELFGSKEERSKKTSLNKVVNPTPPTSANIRKTSEYSSPRASRGLPAAGYN